VADPFRKGLSSPSSSGTLPKPLRTAKITICRACDPPEGPVSRAARSLQGAVGEEEKIVATEQFIFLLNRFVRFKVSDVTVPGPQEVVNELYGGDIVQGKVVDLTENAAQERAFIVVKVEGMKDFLILPAEKVIGIAER
jgi:hypothetical protein